MKKERLVAIDATNRCHLLWHGTQGNGAVDLFFRQLELMISKLSPTWCVACFDQPSFRKEIDRTYKSSRSSNPEIQSVIDGIKARLHEQWPEVPVCEAAGMEADDLLASFAAFSIENKSQAILVTGDKDCRQCLRDGWVTIIKRIAVVKGEIRFDYETASDVKKEFGILAEQWPDFQTLVGDKGDDICGCDGIGRKTAVLLLQRLGSLESILSQPERCPVSKRLVGQLVRFQARADVVRQLVTLKSDLEVKQWLC